MEIPYYKRAQYQSKTHNGRKLGLSPWQVPKIIHVLLKIGPIDRGDLAKHAKINYSDLIKHLELLEKRNVISVAIEDGEITIGLNNRWREYAEMTAELYGL